MDELTLSRIEALVEQIDDLAIFLAEVEATATEYGFIIDSLNGQLEKESELTQRYYLRGAISRLQSDIAIAKRQAIAVEHNREVYSMRLAELTATS